MRQRPRTVAKARARKRPSFVPELLLFSLLALMAWLGYWAFWSVR